MSSSTETVVRIENLCRSFGKFKALDSVSLTLVPGHVYGLVGINGAGKSTLIRHMLGLLRPTSGSVRVFGLDPVRQPVPVLERTGYLSEERDLPEWMNVGQVMRYMSSFYNSWDRSLADELVESFGLDPRCKVSSLSQGMRAQTALVVAVAHRPDLLLLDEPSSGLDPIVRKDILNTVIKGVSESGQTVLFSSHLMDEVELLSDVLLVMDNGRIVQQGAPDEIRQRFQAVTFRADQNSALDAKLTDWRADRLGEVWIAIYPGLREHVEQHFISNGADVVSVRNATMAEILAACTGPRGSLSNALGATN